MRPEVMDAICAYHWPGNVRELENEIRMLITFADDPITLDRLSERIRRALAAPQEAPTQEGLTGRVEALERSEIRRALEEAAGNKSRAAELLGISRFALQRKLEKYAIGADGRPLPPGERPTDGDVDGAAGAAGRGGRRRERAGGARRGARVNRRVVAAIALACALGASARADVVQLKDGGSLEARWSRTTARRSRSRRASAPRRSTRAASRASTRGSPRSRSSRSARPPSPRPARSPAPRHPRSRSSGSSSPSGPARRG
jgi:hypothetical protein